MKRMNVDSSSLNKNQKLLLELEKLIVKFSAQFANASIDEIDKKICEALKQVAKRLDFDRCSLWELSENKAIMIFQYAAPEAKDITGINYKDFPWTFKMMTDGKHTCMPLLDELPEEAAKDKETFKRLDIKSFMSLPYYIGGNPVAILSADSAKHEVLCDAAYITRLKLIGEIITGAFHRKKMEEKYQKYILERWLTDEQIRVGDFILQKETETEFKYEGIIGESIAMKHIFSRIEQVAPTDSVVLLLGETGTGKGVIAKAIHELSRRKEKKMVTVNCAALTPSLIESELFGREKGAYTGSTEMQIGRFELADKGTLILDEITELPLDLQAKLLRAIQEGEFERLGSPKTIKVDVRILALTGRNLKEEVSNGRFRQDLYFRINVFPITIPPLRERVDDIPLLADYFVSQFNRKMQKEIKNISKSLMTELTSYSWPGNVRELEHVIERAAIITPGQELFLAERLIDSGLDTFGEDIITNLAEVEKRHIIRILNKTNWRIEGPRGAAVLLGLHPNTLRARMQKLSIRLKKAST
jgi:formate hydrogenlyase transcriptional activator